LCAQLSVDALLSKADAMFPEGQGAVRAFARDGGAAEKTNELLENATTAINQLFEQRGYDPKKPDETKAKLGYALDRYEATAYLVTGAMHLALLSQPEAWAIGKRIINVIGSSGTIGAKLKALRKRGKATAPQVAALLNAESTLNLEPPPRKRAAPSVLPPPPAPPPPSAPPPLAGTRTASAALIERVKGSMPAAEAAAAAHAYECRWDRLRCLDEDEAAGWDVSEQRAEYDEDAVEIKRLHYKRALRGLSESFPELEICVPQHLDGEHATEHNSRPCVCGQGRLPLWPWMLHRPRLGFCGCDEGWMDVLDVRGDWIPKWMPWICAQY